MSAPAAEDLFRRLEEKVEAGGTRAAVLAIRALGGSGRMSERRSRMRRQSIHILAQLAALSDEPASASKTSAGSANTRAQIGHAALALIAEARSFLERNEFSPADLAAAAATLDAAPDDRDNLLGGAIFISYRRDDSADVVGRLHERLEGYFGPGTVFLDVMSMPIGPNYRKHVHELLVRCRVCLVVIGRDWLTIEDGKGVRRLDKGDDPVRVEIEIALGSQALVVPITVGNCRMPEPSEVPAPIAELVDRSGLPIRPNPDFDRDVENLIGKLCEQCRLSTGATAEKVRTAAAPRLVSTPSRKPTT